MVVRSFAPLPGCGAPFTSLHFVFRVLRFQFVERFALLLFNFLFGSDLTGCFCETANHLLALRWSIFFACHHAPILLSLADSGNRDTEHRCTRGPGPVSCQAWSAQR